MKKLTQEQFIHRAKKVHGDKFDYSKSIYINKKTKILINCPIHGESWQNPFYHLKGNGCRGCYIDHHGDSKRSTLNKFIEDAKKIHDNLYDYKLVNYIANKENVDILCPIHGKFSQKAGNHLRGAGCPQCAKEYKGWTHDKWEIMGNRSNNFKGFTTYIMEFTEENGTKFYKIGKTFKDIKIRENSIKYYKSINTIIIKGIALFCSKLEKIIHALLSNYRYKPIYKFSGSTECFSHIPDNIFSMLKSMSNEKNS